MAKKDRYPELRQIIVANFSSISEFSKRAGIGRVLLTGLIKGRPGCDRKKHRDRVASAIKTLVSGTDITGIWRREKNPTLARRRRLIKEMFIDLEEERHF